jgi:hypothetical protein
MESMSYLTARRSLPARGERDNKSIIWYGIWLPINLSPYYYFVQLKHIIKSDSQKWRENVCFDFCVMMVRDIAQGQPLLFTKRCEGLDEDKLLLALAETMICGQTTHVLCERPRELDPLCHLLDL